MITKDSRILRKSSLQLSTESAITSIFFKLSDYFFLSRILHEAMRVNFDVIELSNDNLKNIPVQLKLQTATLKTR